MQKKVGFATKLFISFFFILMICNRWDWQAWGIQQSLKTLHQFFPFFQSWLEQSRCWSTFHFLWYISFRLNFPKMCVSVLFKTLYDLFSRGWNPNRRFFQKSKKDHFQLYAYNFSQFENFKSFSWLSNQITCFQKVYNGKV